MCKGVLLRSGVPSGAARFGMMSLLGIHFLCRYSTYIGRKKAIIYLVKKGSTYIIPRSKELCLRYE